MNFSKKNNLYKLAEKLFPINRSINSPGNLKTLKIIKNYISNLKIKYFKSGSKCYTWTIPNEWHVSEGYIATVKGKKIIDFKKNNLHIVNYSQFVNKLLHFKDLKNHLYFLKSQPSAIPYITSYYKKSWGFCLSYNAFKKLKKNLKYKVFINSKFTKGKMHFGEVLLKGKSKKEILISTNICHPSMGNNETSGMVVTTALTQWLNNLKKPNYSYRIIFIPETVGSIAYIKNNLKNLQRNVIAGFVVVCVGNKKQTSFLPSRNGNTLADRASKYVLNKYAKGYKEYSFLERGSDERQFCNHKVNLPVCSIMSSKYGEYQEYHTSLDDLKFISAEGLERSLNLLKKTILVIENNFTFKDNYKYPCEPMLSKYNLRDKLSFKQNYNQNKLISNILLLCNGKRDMIEIANILKEDLFKVCQISNNLEKAKLIKKIKSNIK